LWQTPYGTRAEVRTPTGSLLFTGPVMEAKATRPDGAWTVRAGDDTVGYRWRTYPAEPGRRAGNGTGIVTLAGFINVVTTDAGLPAPTIVGDLLTGSINLQHLDVTTRNAWQLIEDQALAHGVDVNPEPNRVLRIGPPPKLAATASRRYKVGEGGTITGYTVALNRTFNEVLLSFRCVEDNKDDTWVTGVWRDTSALTGVAAIGATTYTDIIQKTGWNANPASHQAEANAAAAAAAPRLRGDSRAITITAAPDYTLRGGDTIEAELMNSARDRFMVTGLRFPMQGAMTIEARNPEPGATETKETY
jgi:hypothetical protein